MEYRFSLTSRLVALALFCLLMLVLLTFLLGVQIGQRLRGDRTPETIRATPTAVMQETATAVRTTVTAADASPEAAGADPSAARMSR